MPVLSKNSGAYVDATGPVLGVDHEEPGRADQYVVDVRLRSAGPAAVVNAQVAVASEVVGSLSNSHLAFLAALEGRGTLLVPLCPPAKILSPLEAAGRLVAR